MSVLLVAWAVAYAVRADTATNAFAVAEGADVRVAGDNVFHYSPAGRGRSVKVAARPGWSFRSGRRTETLLLRSGVYEHEVVSDLGEDIGEVRFEPCSFAETEEDEHVSAPEVSLSALPGPGAFLYAAPETEAEVSVAVSRTVAKKGMHRKRTTYAPCPVCGSTMPGTGWEYYEVEPGTEEWEAVGPGHTAYSPAWTHAVAQGAGQEVAFSLSCRSSGCGDCAADAAKTVEFDVAGVYAERQDYVGMDRSDAGRSTPVCRTASVHVQPSIGTATYSWTDCGVCSFDGATDGSSARYRLDDPEASSSGFLAERLSVSVVCANGDGTCSAACVTNFTVVKVDVEIDGVPEEEEEIQGAVLPYMKDSLAGQLTAEGRANLVEVKITCEPADLPQGEMVDIVSPGGFLYERVDGEYRPAQTSYRACEIGGRSFFLHGHAVSSAMCDRAIEASHAASGARDVAKFTVVKVKLTATDLDGMVTDENKFSPGAFVHWNIDNDNSSMGAGGDKHPGADHLEYYDMVTGEDDLMPLVCTIEPMPAQGVLTLSATKALFWSAVTKGRDNLQSIFDSSAQWDLGKDTDRADFMAVKDRLFIEGNDEGTDVISLIYTVNGKTISDTICYNFIAADCGRQPQSNTGEKAIYKSYFPSLVDCEWSITGATDCRYNCLAWAVGRTDIWVNPVLKDSCENSIGDSMEFESNSVHYVGIDGKYGDGNGVCTQSEIDNFFLQEAGVEPTDLLSEATIIYYSNYHAARRRTCSCGRGHWIMFESKCGQGVKIEHVIDQLNGNTYGTPVRFYKPQ